MNTFLDRMNKREKILALIVAGAIVLIVGMGLINFVIEKQASLRSQLVSKQREITSLESLAAARDTWAARDEWINVTQPQLKSQSGAGVQLLDEVKGIARENDVILENPAIGLPEIKDAYRSMPVTVETKSSWKALVMFLHSLQAPERFVAIESIEIKVDAADKTKIHGTFRIARWYAPGGG
jgi:Tfp pilus assembly protein PilO